MLLADNDENANIIHVASSRFSRVTRSVMASEINVLVIGFDAIYTLPNHIQEKPGTRTATATYVYSKTFFNGIAKQGKTTEKRLEIEIYGLRESYTVESSHVSAGYQEVRSPPTH